MKKVLFLIHDLGEGGAEKVLVNLVNNMDQAKFDITVMTLFDTGVNKQFLKQGITYKTCFKHMISGNSHLMKLFSPKFLHRLLIKEKYDIEIAYLEGPCARVISGCTDENTKTVSWIHGQMKTARILQVGFRNYSEAKKCYGKFRQTVFVSGDLKTAFLNVCPKIQKADVLYNTNESKKIKDAAKEDLEDVHYDPKSFNMIGVGKLTPNKGFDRLARVVKRLSDDGYDVCAYILGIGYEEDALRSLANELGLQDRFILLGYQTNPYKYVAKADVFICSSFSEGFSTAATEALIVGTPVCTADVSGMTEMLGNNNEYGIITENSEDGLYSGIKKLLDDPQLLAHYKSQAEIRGQAFSTENSVKAVEDMLDTL